MTSSAPSAYTDIGPAELAGMLEQKDFLLINTHIPYEGEIEQTDLVKWAKAGYTNLYDLNGGFEAWEAAGYPLLQLDGE